MVPMVAGTATMGDEFLDNRLSIDGNEEAYKEKTRIAEVAAVTLCRLNGIMKQMKEWRDDRAKLKSSICRLRLALRVVGRETEDILHADPLIEHQRVEIKRLEESNRSLRKEIDDVKSALFNGGTVTVTDEAWQPDNILTEEFLVEREKLHNEILYLRSRLKEAEGGHEHDTEVEHLKCKLKHFMMVDHTMEIIFTGVVNKVAETIANLSEELVNVSEHLRRSRIKNNDLYMEIDRLRSMLRQRCGSFEDYQKRIAELDNLSKELKSELLLFKGQLEGHSRNQASEYPRSLRNVAHLANDLMSKLRNDHEALLAAGDPDCLKYIKRITELRVSLKQLQDDLARSNRSLSPNCLENTNPNEFLKQISLLEATLEEIIVEIDHLKTDCVMRNFKVNVNEGIEYVNRIQNLEVIIGNAKTTMIGLNHRSSNNSKETENIAKLEGFVDKACDEIKHLELILASNDRSSSFRRIEQLEESTTSLKLELNKRDDLVDTLQSRLSDLKLSLEQKSKDLEDAQSRIVGVAEENRLLKVKSKKMEDRKAELLQALEESRKELEELQQVRHDGNLTKKKLQADKEGLLKEMGRMRDTVQKKNEEIKVIAGERNTMEKALNAKIMDLGKSLQATSREKEKLLNKISELEWAQSNLLEQMKKVEEEAEETARKGSESAMADLERVREELNNANREIIDLKARLGHLSSDKEKLETSICHLESKKEILVYQLGVEKTTAEERLRELTKLTSDYNELVDERTNLRTEKETLERSIASVEARYSELEAEVNRHESERRSLRAEIKSLKAAMEELAEELTGAREEARGAGDKVQRLEFENSRLRNDFDASAATNTGFEDRLRVLVTERDELATRINELDRGNVELKDQLNKVKTENEYYAVELNKLQAEFDKATSEGASLHAGLDEAARANGALQRVNEELRLKVIEAHSEYRILENRLRIAEMTILALRREKESLRREHNLRSVVSFDPEAISNEPAHPQRPSPEFEAKRSIIKSDKTKKNGKDDRKRLTVENEALKFELLNLRSQSVEVKTELAKAREELRRQNGSRTPSRTIADNFQILNLSYEEIHGGRCQGKSGPLARVDQGGPYDTQQESGMEMERVIEIMGKLRIENVALKMELNTLRCNFVVNFAEDERRRNQLRDALEELLALKTELGKLRDERDSLRVRLDSAGTRLNQLESERVALKDELGAIRSMNSDLRQKMNELRCDYQKLREKSAGFECCIQGAIKQIQKYTVGTGRQNILDDELLALLRKYISDEELLRAASEREKNVIETCVDATS